MTRRPPIAYPLLPGTPPQPIDGDALGASWEAWLDAAVGVEVARAQLARSPAPILQTTQPIYRQRGGRWLPTGKGWLDRVLYLPQGRAIHYDAKACALSAHPRRWALPLSLRAELPAGHQVQRGMDLARIGHRAAIVLGVWDAGWSRIYVLPITAGGLPPGESTASRTWEELAPYLTRRPIGALIDLACEPDKVTP